MNLASTTIHLNGKFSYRVRQYGASKEVHHLEVIDEYGFEIVDITLFEGDFERLKEAVNKEPERVGATLIGAVNENETKKEER
jgi:hypothetical protein